MKILAEYGRENLAKVYVAQMRENLSFNKKQNRYFIEFVESVQPPIPREKKWVIIVSSMFGCPIKCKICDAGGDFLDYLTTDEILNQIDFMVKKRFPNGKIVTSKFKIQFARMGEPSLNLAVLETLEQLAQRYDVPGLHISISSVAPDTATAQTFFDKLLSIKNKYYFNGRFQLQFSIHTTDEKKRNELIPIKKWSFEKIARYGRKFSIPEKGDKKVTLNFAPIVDYSIDIDCIRKYFDFHHFLIKLTPVNPTITSQKSSIISAIDPYNDITSHNLITMFRKAGYEVILSIGMLEENQIGSNCGQFIQRAIYASQKPNRSYELERYYTV